MEQVHDAVEQSLLKEVAILRDCQEKFKMMLDKVRKIYLHQNRMNRAHRVRQLELAPSIGGANVVMEVARM